MLDCHSWEVTTEENPWYVSSLHIVVPPTGIIAPFTLTSSALLPARGCTSVSPSAHVTPTLWPPSMHP